MTVSFMEPLILYNILIATQNSSQVLPLATPTPTNASSHSCCLPKNSNTVRDNVYVFRYEWRV